MKQFIPITVLAAIFATSSAIANTAYSTPSGYVTENLQPGFNFVGLTLVNSSVAAGTFTSNTGESLTDSNADFSSLAPATQYILEIGGNGPLAGLIMDMPGSVFSGDTISGLTEITADYLAPYTVRPAATVSQVFGSGENVLLQKGTAATADKLFIPNTAGNGFDTYFHTADAPAFPGGPIVAGRWQRLSATGDQANAPINYLDGFYVQILGAARDLVVTGEVKTSVTSLPAVTGFSYFSSIYPVGSTLASSTLADSVTRGTAGTADLIFIPQVGGGFSSFFHTNDAPAFPGGPIVPGRWQQVGVAGDAGTAPFASGFILQRRGASANIPYAPPAFYGQL